MFVSKVPVIASEEKLFIVCNSYFSTWEDVLENGLVDEVVQRGPVE